MLPPMIAEPPICLSNRLTQEVGGTPNSVGPPRRAAEVEVTVDEFPQAQVPCEGGRQEQAGIGHQAVVVKGDADTVGIVVCQHLVS